MKRDELNSAIERLATSVAEAVGVELVEAELRGTGRHQLLRITIDKPGGVTHGDCENVSRELSERLDAEDPIPGTYNLEVSSPGVERPLKKFQDWERFTGQKAKVILKEPLEGNLKHFDGVIAGAARDANTLTVQLGEDHAVTFPFDLVKSAHLKFEW